MNLPVQIEIENNRRIKYLYNANGTKLRKYFYENNRLMSTTDYCGMFIYKDDHLDCILTSEGRLKPNDQNRIFYAEYFIKDHLGNVRSVISSNPKNDKPVQGTDYYPFGMEIPVYGSSDNQIKYNSKELQIEADLDWYDYGARFYDPVIGRWNSVDPKSEKYLDLTTYNYCANNPIIYIDPEGDTITLSESLRNNEAAWEAHMHWKSTEAGQEFYTLFDIGGDYEGVSVFFDINEDAVTDNGSKPDASGVIEVFGVNEKNGEKTKLYPQSYLNYRINNGQDITGMRSSLNSNEYLRYEINTLPGQWIKEDYSKGIYGRKLWNENIGIIKNKANTINHEANHARIFQNDLTRGGFLWYDADGHHYFMKNPVLYPYDGSFLKRKGYHEN